MKDYIQEYELKRMDVWSDAYSAAGEHGNTKEDCEIIASNTLDQFDKKFKLGDYSE